MNSKKSSEVLKLKINTDYELLNPPLPLETYESLKESIKKSGIWNDLHILLDGTILCGHNRYKIAKELDFPDEKIPYKIMDIRDEIDRKIHVISDNLDRRQLTTPWRIELTSRLLDFEREKAEQRKKSTLMKGNKIPDVENLPPRDEQGKTRDLLGKRAGVSGKTFEKAMKIKEKKPDLWKGSVLDGKKSIDKAYHEIKQEENQHDPIPMPEGDYHDFESLSSSNQPPDPVKKKVDTITCIHCGKPLQITKSNGHFEVN